MTSEQWHQIKRIVQTALEVEPAKRHHFVTENCAGDRFLRDEVQSLLDSYENAGDFIQTPAFVGRIKLLATNNFSPELEAGKNIGHYKVSRELGRGGMGAVYLAEDTRLKRKVAIKILPSDFAAQTKRVRRFEQEALAVSSFNHPNILTIYEIGQIDSIPFIVTEFIDGVTLRQRLADAPMDLSEGLDVFVQVAAALAAAHSAGVVHRDIKPENIMIRHDGLVKVLDFGVAKLAAQTPASVQEIKTPNATEQYLLGTPKYISPEQIRGLADVDARTDIWSLGVVLYEMVTGGTPYESKTNDEIISLILKHEPPPPVQLESGASPELDRIVSKCLKGDRDERYQSAQELLADLKNLKHEIESGGATQTVKIEKNFLDTPRALLPPFNKIPTRIHFAALALVILAVTLAGWYWNKSNNLTEIKTVAVLPLRPLTTNENSKALGLGLTDTLIMKIGGLRQIVVRPISAVTPYADAPQDSLEIGKKLKVDAVLEGTIQQAEGRVRLNVRLLRVENGEQIWAEQFESDAAQIFDLQDRLTAQTAQALKLKLGASETEQITKRFTDNVEALNAYQKGRYFWNRRTVGDLKTAIGYFNEAIMKDPNYALAYAGLADAYSLLADYDGALPRDAYPKAKEAAMEALELDDELAEAHTSLAYVKMFYYWDWQGAQDGYRRAIALNPNYATARHWYSEYLTAMGRFDEALVEIRRAKEIDPLSPGVNAQEVWVLFYARRYDEAIERGLRIAEMNPDYAEIYDPLKRCYDHKGMYAEAIAARQKRRKLAGWDATETAALKSAASTSEPAVYWKKRLEQEIEEARNELPTPFEMAAIYAHLGEKDLAFERLDKAIENRSYPVMFLRVTPDIDPLRADPRFADALRRVGLLF